MLTISKIHSYVVKIYQVKLISGQADLSKPETIPATLVGVHTVIDCATGRPEEPIKTVSIHTDKNGCIIDCLHSLIYVIAVVACQAYLL